MAEAMVSFALERFGDVLEGEDKSLHSSVTNRLDDIKVELIRMQPFLKSADSKQEEDKTIRICVAQIKDLTYQITDLLETYGLFLISTRKRKSRRGIQNLFRKVACMVFEGIALHKIESEIGTIRVAITSLGRNLTQCALTQEAERPNGMHYGKPRQMRKGYPALIDEDVHVRREKDEEQLTSLLLSNSKGSEIICIRGIGGIGKTTIAKRIYSSTPIRRNFERRAWVFVSQVFVIENVLLDILMELLPKRKDEITRMRKRELFKFLNKIQQEEKCIVVLDNVWSLYIWKSLQPAFLPGGISGSKILITTRTLKVGFVHELESLGEEECWKLLKGKAFANGEPSSDATGEIEKMGRKLVTSCCRHPLAIAIAGGALRGHKELSEWKRFFEVTEWNSRGDERFPTVRSIISLSYKSIPYKLQSCFLYLASIPEDYKMEAKKLFQLWIAENMISSEDKANSESTLMDVAESYLIELAERNLVQLVLDEYTEKIIFCRIHDLIRDQCLSEGHADELIQAISLQKTHIISEYSFSYDIRRLSIHMNDLDDMDTYVPPTRKLSLRLRSVFFFLQKYNKRSQICHVVQSNLSSFKRVRVLDLGGLVFSKLDQVIGELIYLKYLGLRYTVFHELPSTIENMSHLQTLDLWDNDTQYAGIIVPNVFCKLKRLSHLYLRRLVGSRAHRKEKLRLNGLTGLETLEGFDLENFNLGDLFELTNLREMGANITSVSHLLPITDYLESNASKLLRKLTLSIKYCDLYSEECQTLLGKVMRCPVLGEFTLHGRTGRLPDNGNNFSKTLTKITLESCELRGNPLSILEKIPNLRVLVLKWNTFVEEKMICSTTGFSQLKVFQLWRLYSLKDWTVEEGAMPNLFSLDIVSCPNLKEIPDGLKFITTLERLLIKWMPKSFINRLREEDYYKVQHASIEIIDNEGEEETASMKINSTPERASSTSKAPTYEEKGKSPIVGLSSEGSSSSSWYKDYEDYLPSENDNIWQLGYPQTTRSDLLYTHHQVLNKGIKI